MTERPRLLDLFCGAGGAAMGYHRAGFEVVGVDINPQKNYPFEFHQGDAMTWPLEGFDAIHASPPCQAYTVAQNSTKNGAAHPDLVAPVRARLSLSGKPWVMENVVGAPLIHPIRLCGSSFGLHVKRHRLFESNQTLWGKQCSHREYKPQFPPCSTERTRATRFISPGFTKGKGLQQKAVEEWAMGINWMSRDELSQAIPPAYTEYIGCQLLVAIQAGTR
jgi:DNA (cytosine-5)-methyltransferase 1